MLIVDILVLKLNISADENNYEKNYFGCLLKNNPRGGKQIFKLEKNPDAAKFMTSKGMHTDQEY